MEKRYDCTFIGDINPDIVLISDGQMPQMGKEIVYDNFYTALGGSTGICAGVYGALGQRAAFYGHVGDDLFGRYSVEAMAAAGVDVSHVVAEKDHKTSVTISIAAPKDRALMSYLGNLDDLGDELLDGALLSETRHIHIGSFFFQHERQPLFVKLFKKAREKGVTTSLDVGWDATENWDYGIRELLKYTDLFFPNESEAMAITRRQDVVSAACELAKCCGTAVVKCGRDGSILYERDTLLRCPTYPKYEAKDPTGAGDSYNAGFLYAYLKGCPMKTCMRYGSATASLRVATDRDRRPWANIEEVEKVIEEG